ncbi:MAG TPA: ABC transporter permease, partial [Solirubrobacteraceae bacterium]
LIRRVAWAALVVAVVTLITFAIFFLLPSGNPAARFAGREATPATIHAINRELGLDHPWYVQYGLFTKHLVLGDQYGWPGLGFSYDSHESVLQQLKVRAPKTLSVALGAIVLWLVLGVSIGTVSAARPHSIWDKLGTGFALLGVSVPVFWLGLLSLYLFWQTLHVLPGTGYVPFATSPAQWFLHLVQPWAVLAFMYSAWYARMTRASLSETLKQDYVRTARGNGAGEFTVVVKHGLRAAITPVVTMLGMDIALLVGGTIVVETIFNIQGIGYWVVQSVVNEDFPVVVGVVVVGAVAVVIFNLIVDIAYAALDPRVRLG